MVSCLNMAPGYTEFLFGVNCQIVRKSFFHQLLDIFLFQGGMENSDFVHCTGKEVSTCIPDPTSTDVDVKFRGAVVCPTPFFLKIFAVNINMDVLCRGDTPDMVPLAVVVFEFPWIGGSTCGGCPEVYRLGVNKTELR